MSSACSRPASTHSDAHRSHADDARLASAAQLTLALAEQQPLSDAELQRRAAIDEDAADYLLHIDDWPIDVRAIELVRELCERTVATRLG